MLKYSVAGEDGTFSPSHKQEKVDALMKEAIEAHNPKGKTKLLMKKRARQKRHEYSLFPPIAQTSRKDTQMSFNSHNDDNELAYVNGHTISRLNDVTTPYLMHSTYSNKIEPISPPPNHKELTRVSNLSGGNYGDIHRYPKENSFTVDGKVHASSPYIERTDRRSRNERNQSSRKGFNNTIHRSFESDKNPKLLLNTNKIGLVERMDRKIKHNSKAEENFSIRKKIEQFRKWHEKELVNQKWHEKEIINKKIDSIRKEVDEQYDADKRKMSKPLNDLTELPPVFSPSHSNHGRKSNEKSHRKSAPDTDPVTQESSGGADLERSPSEQTWRTWRDVNDSYAYTDVKKYIRDNELMGSEKEEWIKKWVIEVNTAMESDSIGESIT